MRSNAVISAMPLLPASRPSQTSGAVLPTPQMRPDAGYDDASLHACSAVSISYLPAFWFFSM